MSTIMESIEIFKQLWSRHSLLIILIIGLVALVEGAVMGKHDTIDWPKTVYGGGVAILGGGVLSAVLRTKEFKEVFLKLISNVFYNPHLGMTIDAMTERWQVLTNAILRSVLPVDYEAATEVIKKRFLSAELEYHFQELEQIFDIDIQKSGSITIQSTLRARVCIAAHAKNAVLRQKVSALDGIILNEVSINQQSLSLDPPDFQQVATEFSFNIRLNDYASNNNSVDFKRIYTSKQKMDSEPYVNATFSRYVQKATVRARISDGYEVVFLSQNIPHPGDGKKMGIYREWHLGGASDLLLPGQGYTLIFIKSKGEMS